MVARAGALRVTGLLAAIVMCVAAGSAACRAVAGIKDLQYQPPSDADSAPPDDAGIDTAPPPDAPAPTDTGPDACPTYDATLLNRPDLLTQLDVISDEVFVSTGDGILGFGTAVSAAQPTALTTAPTAPLTWGSFGLAPALAFYSLTGSPTGGADGGLVAGAIHSVHLDGTNDSPFATATYPYLVLVAAGYVFWTDDPAQALATGTSTVSQCPLGGCMPTSAWITGIGQTYALFADSANVYVLANDPLSPSSAATLYACPLPTSPASPPCGASPRMVFTGVDATSTFSFAADGTFVYGIYAAVMGIVRIPVGGGTPEMILDDPGDTPSNLTLDGTDGHLYWTTTGGSVYRATPDGSEPPALLTCDLSGPSLIATDSASVYFVAQQGAESIVQKIPKPMGP